MTDPVRVRRAWSAERCAQLSAAVLAARDRWTSDFGGEQHSLGRAFYTHLETHRSREYFAGAAASDRVVEQVLPGIQREVRALFADLTGASVRQRPGFCGPGVIIFEPGEKVSREGGVIHFDTEGLTPAQLATRAPAMTLIVVLQSPASGGGLKLWSTRYSGHDHPTEEDLAAPSTLTDYHPGDAILVDSYTLHQIQPFPGPHARLTVTLHGAQIDKRLWEVWF